MKYEEESILGFYVRRWFNSDLFLAAMLACFIAMGCLLIIVVTAA